MAKYTPQTWTDGSGGGTPISAARLTVLENGVRESSMGRSTTFPASPVDGDIHVYPADTTNGIMWMFMWRAAVSDWEFIGGAPLWAEVETSETETNAAFDDMTTAGPSITIPFAGSFVIESQARCLTSSAGGIVLISPKIGAAAASDNDAAVWTSGAANEQGTIFGRRVKVCAAADVIKLQYRVTAGTATIQQRRLFITPVRHTP